ncbi:hypothetical protein [Bradyrhizobium liaoningense]|uniref:hypothetical protein n=1 Tax=Bradyrhizobium liaoningense TaxID=43992 RepID=UPI001BA82D4D|nr:hypothetical protein [Bradyrhizobium liaoningense]MBR1032619.1 hypothetical protein [Bradyrhizobium liaoningense]
MPEGLLVLAGRCRALASSPQIGADAIVGNYDAVEDCSELFLTTIRCSGSFAGRHDWTHGKAIRALLWQSYLCRGLAIHRFDPHIRSSLVTRRDRPECAETSNERALHMFKSQQHRARATASTELVKDSASAEEGRKFNTWRAGFVFLTEHRRNNEIGRDKLTLTKDTPGDARSSATALSRWENEGGSVRDELPM